MSNSFFQFKQFIIHQDKCAMKVTTDACLFGAWIVSQIKNKKADNILDIGTGTGLLSLMIAQENHDASIDALEIDEETAIQAKENADALSFKNRINIINADVRSYTFQHKYDLIICNPPFYENDLRSGSPKKNIAHHHDGLMLDELLPIIKTNLKNDGRFFLLLPFKREEEIRKLSEKHGLGLLEMLFVKQSFHHDYFRIMLMGNLSSDNILNIDFNELSIWDENRQYTNEFVDLLKSYYLYL